MLLTRASEYAIMAAIAIAKEESGLDVAALSERLGFSRSFLSKILQRLAKAGILRSKKGCGGGFTLAASAKSITIQQLVRSAERDSATVFSCSRPTKRGACASPKDCPVLPLLKKLQDKIDNVLAETTLADLLKD
ncbi:MAG: Rrf2 family transcriptional regulator [Helicobacteraceae bacterium]|jgi:Rrf2 family protein|nr:Rrf2 family transcriptional regulator [Helicobacteraceae bacterium]